MPAESGSIGVNHPAIVREIPHFAFLPAFPHFCENVLHFFILYFRKKSNSLEIVIIFSSTKIYCEQSLCKNARGALQQCLWHLYRSNRPLVVHGNQSWKRHIALFWRKNASIFVCVCASIDVRNEENRASRNFVCPCWHLCDTVEPFYTTTVRITLVWSYKRDGRSWGIRIRTETTVRHTKCGRMRGMVIGEGGRLSGVLL